MDSVAVILGVVSTGPHILVVKSSPDIPPKVGSTAKLIPTRRKPNRDAGIIEAC
jgi:hypothetical protein